MGGFRDAGQAIKYLPIDFAGVRLSGDGVDLFEAHLAGDEPVQVSDLGVIPAEERQETGLRARRSFRPAELDRSDAVFNLAQVEHEVVAPETRPLADGGQLGRLEVRI